MPELPTSVVVARDVPYLFTKFTCQSYNSSHHSTMPSKLVPWPENKSNDKQAIPVPGTKRPGQSRVWLTSETY